MRINKAAAAGTLESNDILVMVMPNEGSGIEIELDSIGHPHFHLCPGGEMRQGGISIEGPPGYRLTGGIIVISIDKPCEVVIIAGGEGGGDKSPGGEEMGPAERRNTVAPALPVVQIVVADLEVQVIYCQVFTKSPGQVFSLYHKR